MNKQELNTHLDFLFNDSFSTVIYAVLQNNTVKKLDISSKDLPDIQKLFVQGIKSKVYSDNNLKIMPLSNADERNNCLYEYDLDLPDDFEFLNSELSEDLPVFNFKQDKIDNIDSLLIEIGNETKQVILFKKLSPVEVIGRGGYLLGKASERFEKFEDELLRLTPKFQAIKVEDTIIFTDLKLLERSFGFHDVIVREATAGLEKVAEIKLVENLNDVQELLSDVSFARKVTKIKNSLVLANEIPNETIITFTKTHPALKNKMKYSKDGSKINLKTKLSKVLFIKMLDDAFLMSELTNHYYESLAKDEVEDEAEATG